MISRVPAPLASSALSRPVRARAFGFAPIAALACALALGGCPPTETAPETPEVVEVEPVRVEAPGLGLALADIAPFRVADIGEETLTLVPEDPAKRGELVITQGPIETAGLNLVALWQEHQASIEERGGTYAGKLELGGPLGTIFSSRGTYEVDGEMMEEAKLFAIHPRENRPLIATYVYPQGEDTKRRLEDELFVVFGEVEPLERTADDVQAEGLEDGDLGDESPTEDGVAPAAPTS